MGRQLGSQNRYLGRINQKEHGSDLFFFFLFSNLGGGLGWLLAKMTVTERLVAGVSIGGHGRLPGTGGGGVAADGGCIYVCMYEASQEGVEKSANRMLTYLQLSLSSVFASGETFQRFYCSATFQTTNTTSNHRYPSLLWSSLRPIDCSVLRVRCYARLRCVNLAHARLRHAVQCRSISNCGTPGMCYKIVRRQDRRQHLLWNQLASSTACPVAACCTKRERWRCSVVGVIEVCLMTTPTAAGHVVRVAPFCGVASSVVCFRPPFRLAQALPYASRFHM